MCWPESDSVLHCFTAVWYQIINTNKTDIRIINALVSVLPTSDAQLIFYSIHSYVDHWCCQLYRPECFNINHLNVYLSSKRCNCFSDPNWAYSGRRIRSWLSESVCCYIKPTSRRVAVRSCCYSDSNWRYCVYVHSSYYFTTHTDRL